MASNWASLEIDSWGYEPLRVLVEEARVWSGLIKSSVSFLSEYASVFLTSSNGAWYGSSYFSLFNRTSWLLGESIGSTSNIRLGLVLSNLSIVLRVLWLQRFLKFMSGVAPKIKTFFCDLINY